MCEVIQQICLELHSLRNHVVCHKGWRQLLSQVTQKLHLALAPKLARERAGFLLDQLGALTSGALQAWKKATWISSQASVASCGPIQVHLLETLVARNFRQLRTMHKRGTTRVHLLEP